ncbi:hypothetical protein F511_40950 [Dorcoceras hygrometricum]|uniref:Splicing factor 3B subunit 1-like n=1 Tax=Dorcoceras hygrometricum TaxID=472368 RepID=A0A2Z7B406_9LAMI|nr:hypothetical protein F511_40950 [Dorcoceras hygrometricum]
MASSLINNSIQVYFDSVLGMEHEEMIAMFEALLLSGLSGFLGCSSAIYETSLVEFFHNTSVRDVKVVSTVQGKPVAISEVIFAGTFELPLEGLTDLHEVPKDLVFEARNVFLYDGKNLITSYKKREMTFEFQLLNDILAKSVNVKAGSFDVVTHERFLMMSAIMGSFRMSQRWRNQRRKRMQSKKRPATTVEAPVVKRKRTTTGRAAPEAKSVALVTVAQEVVPIQMVSAVTPHAQKRKAPKRKLKLPVGYDDEIVEKEPDVENVVEQQREKITADDVDKIIDQVISETAQMETDMEEPSLTRSDDIVVENTERSTAPLRSGEDDDMSRSKKPSKIIEPAATETDKEIEPVATEDLSLEKSVATMTDSEDTEPLSKVLELTKKSKSDEVHVHRGHSETDPRRDDVAIRDSCRDYKNKIWTRH